MILIATRSKVMGNRTVAQFRVLYYLYTELKDAYWPNRARLLGVLDYLAALRHAAALEHWCKDSAGAALLAGAVRNDHV